MTTQFEQLEDVRNRFKADGKSALKSCFEDYFKNNPTVLAVQWQQYTPYFNDGDECVFSVRTPYIQTTAAGGFNSAWDKPEFDGLRNLTHALQANADILRVVFGDHSEVTVSADGSFTVESYDRE